MAGNGTATEVLSRRKRASSGQDRGATEGSFLRRFWRLILLVVLIATASVLAYVFDVAEYLSRERVEELVAELGWWGLLVFIGIFTVGQLINIPGIVFVAAAVTAWGKWQGIGASYVATLVSSTAGFLVGRLVGGDAMSHIRWRWGKKAVAHVERRPFRSVTLLVCVLWMAPPLNYTLGMTRVPLWAFLAGTAIGLCPGLLATGFFFDWIVQVFL